VELTWTTFLLEAVNFLVLVWLLKRLFYIPVKRAISERRAAVEKTLHDAESVNREAQELKAKYEDRLQEWEGEKEQQREQFRKELDAERERQLKLITVSVERERQKAEAQAQRKATELKQQSEKEALRQALQFTSRLMGDLVSPELEGRIVELVVKRLCASRSEDFPSVGEVEKDHGLRVQVRSAFTLTESQRTKLMEALRKSLGPGAQIDFATDQGLLAGLEIATRSFTLRANLRDELAYFAETPRNEQH
jgi:F-type H+-transporting ATPase subunit b